MNIKLEVNEMSGMPAMCIEDAIINVLARFRDQMSIEECNTFENVLIQKGCEGFDPCLTSGKLTSLIDLVIYG